MLPVFFGGVGDPPADPPVDPPATPPAGGGFFNSLSEEVRTSPSMLKFQKSSPDDVAKSYINLESKINAKGVLIPGPKATEEEKATFFKTLGRPDTPDGYLFELPKDIHPSLVSDEASQKVFKGIAHQFGLTAEQATGLHGWYITELSNVLKQQDEADEKTRKEAETALRGRWGTTYDTKLALAQRVLNKFGGEKIKPLLEKGLGNDPVIIELFANIGDKLSEDVLGPGGKSQYGGLTPEAANAKIAEIRANPKHPFNDGASPLHKEAVEEMSTLYQIAEGVTSTKQ